MSHYLITILMIFVFGYCGYRIFDFFNIPAAGLVGAMFVVAALSVFGFPFTDVPQQINTVLQAMVGIMIGSRFDRKSFELLRSLLVPALAIAVWMVGTGLIAGIALYQLTHLDLITSIFSASPGGIAEMSVIALDYDVEVSTIALLQFFRIIGTYAIIPVLGRIFSRKSESSGSKEQAATSEYESDTEEDLYPLPITLLVGLGGGYFAWSFNMPAGGIIGAMVLIGVLQQFSVPLKPLPREGVLTAQIGLGGLIGLRFQAEMIDGLSDMIVPVVLLTLLLLGSSVVLAMLIRNLLSWDMVTCLLSSATAGISQMGIIALEMDADAVVVSLLHLVRIVSIITFLPPIIALLASM